MRYEDPAWLRANCRMIHYFGLGFIQLKLDDSERMHFYVPGLEPIVPEEDVHDHRYDFESSVIRGSLTQELFSYAPAADGMYTLEEVSCEEGASPQRAEGLFSLTRTTRHTYVAGSSYWIGHEQFHRVSTGPQGCVTLVRRSGYKKPLARVIKPVGGERVCPFARKLPEDELWRLVGRMLEG